MAASQATLQLRNNSDANFRLWGEFISNGLLAGGWTLESTDINWTTVNAPGPSSMAGYEIWRSPVETGLTRFYLKLRYGSTNSSGAEATALEYSVSWAYSGSGSALGGTPTTAVSNSAITNGAEATARLCTITALPGELVINLGNGSGSVGNLVLLIGRSRNASLAKTDTLLIVYKYNNNSTNERWTITKIYKSNSTEVTNSINTASGFGNGYTQPPTSVGSGAVVGGKVALGFISAAGPERTSPGEQMLGCLAQAVGTAGETVTIPIYGVNRTYIISSSVSDSPGAFMNSSFYAGLFLYE